MIKRETKLLFLMRQAITAKSDESNLSFQECIVAYTLPWAERAGQSRTLLEKDQSAVVIQ